MRSARRHRDFGEAAAVTIHIRRDDRERAEGRREGCRRPKAAALPGYKDGHVVGIRRDQVRKSVIRHVGQDHAPVRIAADIDRLSPSSAVTRSPIPERPSVGGVGRRIALLRHRHRFSASGHLWCSLWCSLRDVFGAVFGAVAGPFRWWSRSNRPGARRDSESSSASTRRSGSRVSLVALGGGFAQHPPMAALVRTDALDLPGLTLAT